MVLKIEILNFLKILTFEYFNIIGSDSYFQVFSFKFDTTILRPALIQI